MMPWAPTGTAGGLFLQEPVGIAAGPRGRDLFRAETVAEPAHDDADEEADRLGPGRGRSTTCGLMRRSIDGSETDGPDIHHLLPEGAAEHRAVAFVHDTDGRRPALAVAAAHDHGRPGGNDRSRPAAFSVTRPITVPGPQRFAGKISSRMPAFAQRLGQPVALRQAVETGRAGIGGVARDDAGEARQRPSPDSMLILSMRA